MSAIYLDTSIIPQGGNLDTLEFSSLRALAREGGHEVVIPELVVDEAASQRLRAVEAVFDALRKAHRDARAFATIPLLGDLPIPGELVREYRGRLASACRIIELPDGAGKEALRRETFRLPPAREGRGARDSAIWLAIKAAHEARGEKGYFLTNNSKDFADPMDKTRLHPTLQAEINGEELQLIASIGGLVELMASDAPKFIDESFVHDHEGCSRAVIRSLEESSLRDLMSGLGLSAAGKESTKLYLAGPVRLKLLSVHDSRAFSIEDRQVGIAWSQWDLVLPIGVLERTGSGMSQATFEVPCKGTFQLWVRIEGDAVSAEAPHIRNLKAEAEASEF